MQTYVHNQANEEQQLDISTSLVTFAATNLNSIQSSDIIHSKLILSAAPAEKLNSGTVSTCAFRKRWKD